MFQKKWLVIQLSGSWGGDLSHGKKKGRWARMSLQALLPLDSLHCSEVQISHLEDKGVRLGDQTDLSSAPSVPLAL